jgi:hypothetical protein
MEQFKYFNFLYVANEDCFLGYMKKLNKKEKVLLNAKLIWKRQTK